MSDQPPRRPILKLKSPPALPVEPPSTPKFTPAPAPMAAPPPPAGPRWKCKPCGANVLLTGAEAPAEVIRCPDCNARLGTAGDFAVNSPRVRARRIEGA